MKNQHINYCFQLTCLVLYFFVFGSANGALSQPKRINNQQRLFPFPRVGRSGENTWEFDSDKANNKLDYSGRMMPILGGTDYEDYQVHKRSQPKNINTGLWFGPRLGRIQKRNWFMYDNIPREFMITPESESVRHVHYTPRLGRTTEDYLEDDLPLSISPDHI